MVTQEFKEYCKYCKHAYDTCQEEYGSKANLFVLYHSCNLKKEVVWKEYFLDLESESISETSEIKQQDFCPFYLEFILGSDNAETDNKKI